MPLSSAGKYDFISVNDYGPSQSMCHDHDGKIVTMSDMSCSILAVVADQQPSSEAHAQRRVCTIARLHPMALEAFRHGQTSAARRLRTLAPAFQRSCAIMIRFVDAGVLF